MIALGMGVSGGYQAARRGPSMCPGGEEAALDLVLPLLEKVAAKDGQGKACVRGVGMGGAGHYIKMIHNGIEHGMMSALAEAWQIMSLCLGLNYDEIGEELARWNGSHEMVSVVTDRGRVVHALSKRETAKYFPCGHWLPNLQATRL